MVRQDAGDWTCDLGTVNGGGKAVQGTKLVIKDVNEVKTKPKRKLEKASHHSERGSEASEDRAGGSKSLEDEEDKDRRAVHKLHIHIHSLHG